MGCTSKHDPWSREWIEVLHKGREFVDGRPRKTYQEIAEELGTTRLKVEKAALRYGARRTVQDSARTRYFTNSEQEEILRIIEDGVMLRLMCSMELRKLLASRGFQMSKPTLLRYVRRCEYSVRIQYKANVERKRLHLIELATMRRMAKWRKEKQDERLPAD